MTPFPLDASRISPILLSTLLSVGLAIDTHGEPPSSESPTPSQQWLEAHRKAQPKRYFGEPIDLSLRDADLVEVLRSFAEIGRFNLVIQPNVQGKVTVELKNVPWDQALEQILKINNLGMEISGGRARVGTGLGRPGDLRDLSPTTVRLELRHADPALVARALDPPDATGAIAVQARTEAGILVLTGTRATLHQVGSFLARVDTEEATAALAELDPAARERRYHQLWRRLRQQP
ncbi:MAG: secretin and TonB N-terminal domain-containing protein [Acidobacteriota bacterium]